MGAIAMAQRSNHSILPKNAMEKVSFGDERGPTVRSPVQLRDMQQSTQRILNLLGLSLSKRFPESILMTLRETLLEHTAESRGSAGASRTGGSRGESEEDIRRVDHQEGQYPRASEEWGFHQNKGARLPA
jgi:hypothetical protein